MEKIDFSEKVLNIFPEYQTRVVFKAVVVNGLIKVHSTEKGDVILTTPSAKIVRDLINPACEYGHIGYHHDTQYVFENCSVSIKEVGDVTKTNLVEITVEHLVGVGISYKIFDAEGKLPWYNSYINKSVDGNLYNIYNKD